MEPLRAKDLMHRDVTTVTPELTLLDLAATLEEENIHGAPVVDPHGKLVGVVSYTDLVRGITEERTAGEMHPYFWNLEHDRPDLNDDHAAASASSATVGEVMSTVVVTAESNATAAELAKTMSANAVHRILICEDGVMRGIVSITDLLTVIPRYEEALG